MAGPKNGKTVPRLADYFAILTLDETQIRHGTSSGITKQRFPNQDWEDVPFPQNIQMFCMPQGWNIIAEKKDPVFFVATLTDLAGAHQYIFCLQTFEQWDPPLDGDEDRMCNSEIFSVYKPTVFVFISSYPFVELFRVCMNMIFNSIKLGDGQAAKFIATIIGNVKLHNGPQSFRFGEETLTVRAPLQHTIPMTSSKVWSLVRNLGSIHNLLLLFRCVLSEQNLIFHSSSLNRLFDASYALRAIIYPLEFVHTLVSILPEPLLDYLGSPTPYMMGILTSSLPKIPTVECILVDLDLGEIKVSSEVHIPEIPQPYADRLIKRLQYVLNADLSAEDNAIPPPITPMEESFVQDKKIRACFLSFFVELFHGYRTCLELVRLYESPYIVFHQAAFMGMRKISDSFTKQVLNSQMFQLFITTRGIPFRESDYFDDIISKPLRKNSVLQDYHITDDITSISEFLANNEKQPHIVSPLYWRPKAHQTEQYLMKTNDLVLDQVELDSLIGIMNSSSEISPITTMSKVVPEADSYLYEDHKPVNSRRLQVLEKCIEAIFDKRLVEARKMMSAVELSLKLVEARVFLCRTLSKAAVPVSKATLTSPQFELVVRLLNFALDHETTDDEHGIAYACIHLSNIYCRVLSQGVFQFVYSCIQNHAVWKSHRFWESSFFHDVHLLVKKHYFADRTPTNCNLAGNSRRDLWNLGEEPNSMRIAAERLKASYNEVIAKDDYKMEEQILFGQAKHYINLMIYLRVPLDIMSNEFQDNEKFDSESIKASSARERSLSHTDGDDAVETLSDIERKNFLETLVNWISRMMYGMCSSAGMDTILMNRLIEDVQHFSAIHMETIELVHLESKKLVPISKPSLMRPLLLSPHEKIIIDGLRSVLLESSSPSSPDLSSVILPAEGALYLTNYRIIFKGKPISSNVAEKVIVSIPIMSLIKKKALSDHLFNQILVKVPLKNTQGFHSAFHLRTVSFQPFYCCFDEEVSSLQVENYWKKLTSVRWPVSIPQSLYAYSSEQFVHQDTTSLIVKSSSKFPTIRDLKNSLNKPAKGNTVLHRTLDGSKWSPLNRPSKSRISFVDNDGTLTNDKSDYLSYWSIDPCRPYIKDYDRLKERNKIRSSFANNHYDLAKTFPSCVLVPSAISDDLLLKICKGYKHGRFPVITWVNPTGCLLLRGSSFTGTNVMTKIKKQASMLHRTDSAASFASTNRMHSLLSKEDLESTSSMTYQLQYFNRIVDMTSDDQLKFNNSLSSFSDSLLSLVSTEIASQGYPATPNLNEKRSTSSDMKNNFIRSSTRASNLLTSLGTKSNIQIDKCSIKEGSVKSAHCSRRKLYLLVDKANYKMLDANEEIEVVLVNYPTTTDLKNVFKKLCRTLHPSVTIQTSFISMFSDSGWLQMIQDILLLSSSITSLMNTFHSSVAICIEEGWDATCQLSSLVQICSDPFYRTIEGFGILVEKEWLAFGHRFSYRGNHSISSLNSELAPVFLVFLDALHQILMQFPNAFEFNDYFLRFIAYHSSSAYFRTFLLDCEADRLYIEKLSPDHDLKGNIWNYISSKMTKTHMFLNLQYDKSCAEVLVPSVSIASMDIWSFFTSASYCSGSSYDLDIADCEQKENNQMNNCGDMRNECSDEIITNEIALIDFKANKDLLYLTQAKKKNSIERSSKIQSRSKSRESSFEVQPSEEKMHYGDYDKFIQSVYEKKAIYRILKTKTNNHSVSLPNNNNIGDVANKQLSKTIIAHQGYLSKKGARIKLKTDRWYVLDSASRQLICFDHQSDKVPRSIIELSDIKNVDIENTGNKHVLVLTTVKRVHHLQASSRTDADAWKKNIEHLLHE